MKYFDYLKSIVYIRGMHILANSRNQLSQQVLIFFLEKF